MAMWYKMGRTPLFSGQLPTLGLWMVGHQCAGMSIREDCYDIIGNDAHFAINYFVEERQDFYLYKSSTVFS